jgi:predicted ATPase
MAPSPLTHLQQLAAAELLRLAQSEPDLEYFFRHTLIQETAYTSLLKAQRRDLHRAVGEALERLYPERRDELAALLAQHFLQAGENERARAYFIQAGEDARRRYANDEAVAAYTQALELTDDDAARFDLLAARVRAYDVMARRDEQRAGVDAMLALAEALHDATRHCDALLALAGFYQETEHLRLREPAEQAAALARQLSDRAREGRALHILGDGALQRRDFAGSRAYLEAATACFREAGLAREAAACLSTLALAFEELGDLPAAQQAAEEAVAQSQATGDRRQAAVNLRRLAVLHSRRGHGAEALESAQRSLALSRELGDPANECRALNTLGVIESTLQHTRPAQAYYLQSLALAETLGALNDMRMAIFNYHEELTRAGAYETEIRFLETQWQRAQRRHDDYLTGTILAILAWTYAALGQYAHACELEQAGVEIRARVVGWADRSFLGRMQAELGQFAQAHRTLAEALARAGASGAPQPAVNARLSAAYAAWLEGDPAALRPALVQVQEALALLADFYGGNLEYSALDLAGRLHLALDEPEAALEHTTRALRLAAGDSDVLTNEQALWTHARALRAAGRADEARAALQQAHARVMLVAAQTEDAALRRSWLEQVHDNREIVAAWEAGA